MKHYVAGNSFLPPTPEPEPESEEDVSIPFTSGNSFLHKRRISLSPFTTGCVNPLHVGELISTLPDSGFNAELLWVSIPFTSGNSFLPSPLFFVDFLRVSSLDFWGIFQTILKTAVFSVTSTFLGIFYKSADSKGHAFLQI